MTESKTVKVKVKTNPEQLRDDLARKLLIKSLEDYCTENEIELEQKDKQELITNILEYGVIDKLLGFVDMSIDLYMDGVSVEDDEEVEEVEEEEA